MTRATRLTRLAAAVALATGCVGCDLLLRLREDLELTADSTSLGAGESVRVSVQKKAPWFRAAGPTLDLVIATADLPPVPEKAQGPFATCCSTLLALKEGQQMGFPEPPELSSSTTSKES